MQGRPGNAEVAGLGTPELLDARRPEAWLRRFARTTPGVIGAIAVVVASTCLVAGVVCGAQLDARIATSRAVLDRSEPLAYSAQKLYAALSAADSSAATAFLSAGIETTQMRARYRQAIADAASALADTTAGAADRNTRTALAQLSEQLADYTGLVESADANNRQKFVVGSSYFREASWLMRTVMLPGAKKVYDDNLAALDEDQRAVGSTPLAALMLVGIAIVAVGFGSVILVGRTNRQFNLGLVIAAAVMVLVLMWTGVATWLAATRIEQSRSAGTATLARLGNARIVAEKARTDETLELISRTDIAPGETTFTGHLQELSALLEPGPVVAANAVTEWAAAHRRQVAAYTSGDYLGAVKQAIGDQPDGSAQQFALVESSLGNEIEGTRTVLRERVTAAGASLAWSPTGTLALSVVAAVTAGAGLWPRLKEFL